jgi:hypothetical protein
MELEGRRRVALIGALQRFGLQYEAGHYTDLILTNPN